MSVQDTTEELSAFTRDWQEWHTGQETRLADPHGFLAMQYPAGYDASRLRKDLVRLVKR